MALARAIVCEPKLILLDEPLAALDASCAGRCRCSSSRSSAASTTTFVFVTHDQDEAITMSDRIVVMSHGRIEQVGTPKDLYYRPHTRFVAGFFGDNNLIPGTVSDHACRSRSARCLSACRGIARGAKVLVTIRPEALAARKGPSRISSRSSPTACSAARSRSFCSPRRATRR